MEDRNGSTHLFYRLYSNTGNIIPSGTTNNIYHLDIFNSIDTLFIRSETWEDSSSLICNIVHDFEFWHNDPTKFIYCGYWWFDFEGGSFVYKFDNSLGGWGTFHGGMGQKIELSKQNDSLIYITIDGLYKSSDGGHKWLKLNLPYYNLVSMSPYNDKEIFVIDENTNIQKTDNACETFSLTDTVSLSPLSLPTFFYDIDSIHYYSVSNSFDKFYLSVSNNKGENDTWVRKYSSDKQLYISIDYAYRGILYLTDGNNILISTDFGNSFNSYKTLDTDIVGIYKKPGSDKLYAATKYDIYEITPSSIKSIKHVHVLQEILDYYPLHVGDVWIYNGVNHTVTWGCPGDMVHVRKVVDKVKQTNNKIYFKIKEEYYCSNNPRYYYERIDTNSGKIFRYNIDSSGTDSEYLIDVLTASKGDTVFSYRFGSIHYPLVLIEEYDTIFIKKSTNIKTYFADEFTSTWKYKLAEGLGLVEVSSGDDNRSFTYTLLGAVISGIVYGDTTLTNIITEKSVHLSYNLYQNYPNPFNPSTTITYEIPKAGSVQLKICNILGQEISTLVNEIQTAGKHSVLFNAQQTKKQLSSGIYFYKLKFGNDILNRKMTFLK